MRIIQRTAAVPIAAGGVVDNVLAGSAFEFLPSNAIISMGVNCGAGMLGTLNVGATAVVEESVMATGTDFPTIPDDMFYTFAGAQGDRLTLRLRNPTAGALNYWVLVQIQEV